MFRIRIETVERDENICFLWHRLYGNITNHSTQYLAITMNNYTIPIHNYDTYKIKLGNMESFDKTTWCDQMEIKIRMHRIVCERLQHHCDSFTVKKMKSEKAQLSALTMGLFFAAYRIRSMLMFCHMMLKW